ncbi:hypothetical protein HBB16_05500, partial [Pseudonocardia sp. MCCB 268]|nr:hypothetical protein [Pseudonocardia cytotoxica]
ALPVLGDDNRPASGPRPASPWHERPSAGSSTATPRAWPGTASRSATASPASRSSQARSAAYRRRGWVLDVRPARHVRLPQLQRRDGPVHAGLRTRARVHKVSPELSRTTPRSPSCCPALHAVERATILFDDVVVVAGCGPIGLAPIAGAPAKNPKLLIALTSTTTSRAGPAHWRRPHDQHREGVDAVVRAKELTDGYGADVHLEGFRARSCRRAGLKPAAQARHVRRVLGLARGDRRLVDHLRRQGARRPRRPPRPALLACRDQDAGGRKP